MDAFIGSDRATLSEGRSEGRPARRSPCTYPSPGKPDTPAHRFPDRSCGIHRANQAGQRRIFNVAFEPERATLGKPQFNQVHWSDGRNSILHHGQLYRGHHAIGQGQRARIRKPKHPSTSVHDATRRSADASPRVVAPPRPNSPRRPNAGDAQHPEPRAT